MSVTLRQACTKQFFLLIQKAGVPIMPERYEREIEDILRNMKRAGPKSSFRERLHLGRRGQASRPEQMRSRVARATRHRILSTSEWCLPSRNRFGAHGCRNRFY